MDVLVKLVKCCSKANKVFIGVDGHFYYTHRSMNCSLPIWTWIKRGPNEYGHTYFEPTGYALPKNARRKDIRCSVPYVAPMSKYEREYIKLKKDADFSIEDKFTDWEIIKSLIDYKI